MSELAFSVLNAAILMGFMVYLQVENYLAARN